MNRERIIKQYIEKHGTNNVILKDVDLHKLQELVMEDLWKANIFEVKLPPLSVKLKRTKTTTAWVKTLYYKREYRYESFEMGFSTVRKWDIQTLLNIIAHEHIHYYIAQHLQTSERDMHGRLYKSYMNKINSNTTYIVSIDDENFTFSDKYTKKVGGLIFEKYNGKYLYIGITDKLFNVLKKYNIGNAIQDIYDTIYHPDFGAGDDEYYIRQSLTRRRWHFNENYMGNDKRKQMILEQAGSLIQIANDFDVHTIYLISHDNNEFAIPVKRKLYSDKMPLSTGISLYQMSEPFKTYSDSVIKTWSGFDNRNVKET